MVEARRKPKETTPSFIRRFSRKVRMSGLLNEARKRRFHKASLNKKKRKEKALRRIQKRQEATSLR